MRLREVAGGAMAVIRDIARGPRRYPPEEMSDRVRRDATRAQVIVEQTPRLDWLIGQYQGFAGYALLLADRRNRIDYPQYRRELTNQVSERFADAVIDRSHSRIKGGYNLLLDLADKNIPTPRLLPE